MLIVVTTLSSSNGEEIAPPELIARGFAESDELLGELGGRGVPSSASSLRSTRPRSSSCRSTSTTPIGQIVYDRTRRRPMVLPVVIEV